MKRCMGKEFCGSVIVPGSRVYNKARQIFNRSIQKYPASIIYCEDEDAVIRAVQAAGKTGHTVRVRSGGHN